MSVNITVNGKYTKSFVRHNLLNDPEQVRKETENELRKKRIQQVRAASKNMARKVRNDVEFEKERQLKKIEEIKAQEMEMWRQNANLQQEKDLRSAIFQVGAAHRAAKAENSKAAQKKTLEKCKNIVKLHKNVTISSTVGKENVSKDANVQTDITCKYYPKPSATLSSNNYFGTLNKLTTDSTSEFEKVCEDENSTLVTTEFSSNVLHSSTSSLSDSDEISEKTVNTRRKQITKLNKTTPVLMEVQPESETSLIDTPNIEDHHKQSNRYFSQVISRKTSNTQQSKSMSQSEDFRSTVKEPVHSSTSAAAKKRFTQISDIIRLHNTSDEAEASQPLESCGGVRMQISPTKSKYENAASVKSWTSGVRSSPTKSLAIRPISTQTGGTLTSKSSTSNNLQRCPNAKVQFYDYNNKFQKQYEHSTTAVKTHDLLSDGLQMDAMQQAKLADKLREARELEMDKLRQKSSERCQKAIEREQVRRACEDLTAKLDAMTKQRQVLQCDNHQFSSHRIGQVAVEKEIKLNNAVEDILRRPAVITCPVVNRHKSEHSTSSNIGPRANDNDLNLGSALKRDDFNNLNSSDSCCSILLGYVNGQSKQIADDIKKYNKQNGDTDKVKAEKLQDLLSRINRLRGGLINELEKCSASATTTKETVQNMMDSISEFRKERENILIDSNTKDSISRRENSLKKKEAILEKKLREFYEIQKASKKNENVKNTIPHKEGWSDKAPDRIRNRPANELPMGDVKLDRKDVQTVSQKRYTNSGQSEAKKRDNPRSDSTESESDKDNQYHSSQDDSSEGEKYTETRNVFIGKKPVEIVIKLKEDAKSKKKKKLPTKSPRKLCTLIQCPTPKKSRKKLHVAQSNESSSTSYRSLPPTIHNNVNKILKNVTKIPNDDKEPPVQTQGDKNKDQKLSSNLNPLMAHYVQRLLGMSRNSINALGVSSSDIDTPSNSIINTTANVSAAETDRLASNRLEHVQKFIEDNYSFIGQLEESIRQSNSTDSSLKTVEVIWRKALKEQAKKDALQALQAASAKPIKSVLKKPSVKTNPDYIPEKKQNTLVDKSTQLTDNCTQRIAELTEMINKVRQEKQKILETTLSSASETGRNSTEYLDLPDRRNISEESTSKILDSQLVKSDEHLSTKSTENIQQLEKNKIIGISRDSGISESRPITVQETRDTPTEDLLQAHSSAESLSLKKPKPPISIARYSPQLVEDIPHELSTIFEVDTPATSRINTSIHANNGQDLGGKSHLDDRIEKITYKKFPTFEEYARLNRLDMSQFDPEFSLQFEKEFTEFINLAKQGGVTGYEQFDSFSKYFAKSLFGDDKEATEDIIASLKLANLAFKKFPTRKEYLDQIGVSTSDLLDSRSLEKTEDSRNINTIGSSTESLMDIEEELKLRHILTRSFKQNAQSHDKTSNTTSATVSPRKFLQEKTHIGDVSGIRLLTTTTDDQSDNFENDLKLLGIKWPSQMKKRTMETQALSSSTSSSLGLPVFTPRRKPLKQATETALHKESFETTQTEEGGRLLNLREFLTKELLKRTTTPTSLSYSDESIASSFVRSIIGSMNASSQQQINRACPNLERHKTSTPVASQSTSSEKETSRSQGGVSSVQLFSGESRLSSVHFNNSSKDENQNARKNVGASTDNKKL